MSVYIYIYSHDCVQVWIGICMCFFCRTYPVNACIPIVCGLNPNLVVKVPNIPIYIYTVGLDMQQVLISMYIYICIHTRRVKPYYLMVKVQNTPRILHLHVIIYICRYIYNTYIIYISLCTSMYYMYHQYIIQGGAP